MAYNWDVPAGEKIRVAVEDPNYSDLSIYQSYVQSLPDDQFSALLDPALLSGTDWSNSAYAYPTPGQETIPDPPAKEEEASVPSAEAQPFSWEYSDEGDHKTALLGFEERLKAVEQRQERIEHKLDEIDETMKSLRTGLEEDKTRFCKEIDDHIGRLRLWASEVQGIFGRVTEYNRPG